MNLFGRVALAMIAAAAVAAVLTVAFFGQGIRGVIERVEQMRLLEVAGRKADTLSAAVEGLQADTLMVARGGPSREVLAAVAAGQVPASEALDQVQRVFRSAMLAKPTWLQVRLIAASTGREVVRLERGAQGDPVRVVPEAELQDKGHRPYVGRGLAVAVGAVYVSPIELNREHGVLQVPHVPVIRGSTPVAAEDGTVVGLCVVNLDLRLVLQALRTEGQQTYVVNKAGDYLVHPNRAYTFGGELPHGIGIAQDWPEAHAWLQRTAGPAVFELASREGRPWLAASTPIAILGRQDGLRMLLVEGSAWGRGLDEGRWLGVSTVLVVLVLVGGLALLLARTLTMPLRQMTAAVVQYGKGEAALDLGSELGALPLDAAGEIGLLARAMARMQQQVAERKVLLEEERQRLRRVVSAAPVVMVLVDSDWCITLSNQLAQEYFAESENNLLGRSIELLMPEQERARQRAELERFVARSPQGGQVPKDLRVISADGDERIVQVGLSVLEDREAHLWVLAMADVTQRMAIEKELRRSNEELEQFAYVASHDLQEPLRMVASYTELLAKRYGQQLDERADQYIHFAVSGARRMGQLINDLLSYSRAGHRPQRLEPLELDVLVADVLVGLRSAMDDARAEVELGPIPRVQGDASQIRQVLQNLIANALKFRREERVRIEIAGRLEEGKVRVSVADNGIGLETRHAARVFQMFQRLHRNDEIEGSGIGLAIAKRIIERHGGTLWYEGELGVGTTFYFTLKPFRVATHEPVHQDSPN